MADPRRFPQDFDEIAGAAADGDYLLMVDVSDTTQSASGTTKKTLWSRIKTWLFASSEIGGALADADTLVVNDATDSTVKTSLLSRFWTYIQGKSAALSEIGGALADADTIPVIDATDSTEKRTLLSRISTYIQTAIPIAVGSWTPTYSAQTNLTSTTNLASYYIRVSNRWAFCTYFQSTRNSATVGKSFTMTLPSFVTNNFSNTHDCIGAGAYATNNDVTAANVYLIANTAATTAAVSIYDTASSGSRGFIIAGIGIVP
jgi:hypothetical protein